jgi:DNA-binding HxlR family transcriptional regulator
MVSDDDIALVASGRWLMPLLAEMSAEGSARFAVLLRRLGVSRSALSRSIGALEARGWLSRNPGHGHPLRPEYLLTGKGRAVAAWCERAMAARRRLGLEPEDLGRWSLPLVRRLDRRWKRFSTLEAELRPITPRSLSLALKGMIEVRLLERRLEDAFPPTALYGLTGRGQRLARALG